MQLLTLVKIVLKKTRKEGLQELSSEQELMIVSEAIEEK